MCLPKITKGTGHFFFFLKCCSGMWRRHHRGGDTKKLEFYLIFFYQTQGLLSKFTHDTVEPEGQRVRAVMIHITSHHVYFAATCMNFCGYIWIFPSTTTRPPPTDYSPSAMELSEPEPVLWYSGKSNPSVSPPMDCEMSRRSSIRSPHSGLSRRESPSGDGGL